MPKYNEATYINKLFNKRGNTIKLYGSFTNTSTPTEHKCSDCNTIFITKPINLLHGSVHGCKACGIKLRTAVHRKSGKVYKKEADNLGWIVKDKDYVDDNTRINHRCKDCNKNRTLYPNQILCQGAKCKCKWRKVNKRTKQNRSSTISKIWLETIERKFRIKIEHAWNGGERVIISKGRYCHVDGFNSRKNIVFEFLGDRFHGNPNVFSSKNRCHPFDKSVTAGELLDKTRKRTRFLKSLGYRVLFVWEKDFNKGLLFSSRDRL